MATKTFSGRADERRLADAEARARRDYGVSYGTYCGTILLDVIDDQGGLPRPSRNAGVLETRQQAWSRMKERCAVFDNPAVAAMSDEELKDLVAERYA